MAMGFMAPLVSDQVSASLRLALHKVSGDHLLAHCTQGGLEALKTIVRLNDEPMRRFPVAAPDTRLSFV